MIRYISLLALAAFATSAAAQNARIDMAEAPSLKAEVTVTGEFVRIGDLVDNAGPAADIAIFRAPDPGQTGSVPAARVADAVRAHQIAELDTRGLSAVVVTRASRAITMKDIEARLTRALAGQHGLGDANNLAVIFDTEIRTLQVEPNVELGIARLSYEPRSGRFDATFDLPGSQAMRKPLRLTGQLVETYEAVVLTRALAQNDVLKASDLTIERRPKAEVTSTTILKVDQAMGLAARRALRPGQAIRQADLMKPEVVRRDETVTIIYEVPGIVLTVRGKAMESGAQGDLINVMNVQSKRTLQATVVGPGRVVVTSPTAAVAAPRLAANVPATDLTSRRNAE